MGSDGARAGARSGASARLFFFVGNDNDFITQNGFKVRMRYKDPSGTDVDTLLLVYRVMLPKFPR